MHSIFFIVFLPLVAAAIAGLGNRSLGVVPAKVITTGALFVSCLLSWPIFIGYLSGSAEATVTPVLHFITSGTFDVSWALRVDALTAVMLVVITSVSALVHLYSWGYMAEDPDQPRFFAYLCLFTFAMLMLVTADNLIQMFFGWEGVGLASYLLIGFWFRKPSANAAAIKAFVVNRVGDLGFMLGIFGTYLVFNTVSIPAILAAAPSMAWLSPETSRRRSMDTRNKPGNCLKPDSSAVFLMNCDRRSTRTAMRNSLPASSPSAPTISRSLCALRIASSDGDAAFESVSRAFNGFGV